MLNRLRGSRSPVKREGAERYLLLSLVSFAASVVFTRLFLQVTGYPQLGNSTLHIAHVLWGGLLLFFAALLPLIFANRWVFNTSAILGGVGVGLFIDEVGKFITQTNDYFYPPAAPIIYAFFLLTVLIYMRVRRPPLRDPRNELYRVLEGLTEVLDHDLDPRERGLLEVRLLYIAERSDDPNLRRLAYALVEYLEEKHINLVKPAKTRLQEFGERIGRLYTRHVTQQRLRLFLVFALGGMGVLALLEFGFLIWRIPAAGAAFELLIEPMVTAGELRSANDALWFIVRVLLEGVTGILLIISGGMILVGKERAGIHTATLILIIWLTIINLLVFYLDQFGAVVTTLTQFFVLLALTYYRRMYLKIASPTGAEMEPAAGPGQPVKTR